MLLQCDKSSDRSSSFLVMSLRVQKASPHTSPGTTGGALFVVSESGSHLRKSRGLVCNLGSTQWTEKVIDSASLFMLFCFFFLIPILHPNCFSASNIPNSLEQRVLLWFKAPVFGFIQKYQAGSNYVASTTWKKGAFCSHFFFFFTKMQYWHTILC